MFSTSVLWRDGYEIHYTSECNSLAPVEGPVLVYFPVREESYASTFIPVPGLNDRDSPDFDPTARPVRGEKSFDRFTISPEGIRSSNPYPTGIQDIVARLMDNDGFKHVFSPCEPPSTLWKNMNLARLPTSPALAAYCEALSKEYANGFVETQSYRIEPGVVEDTVLAAKPLGMSPTPFLEILRHPRVQSDFEVKAIDAEMLLRGWITHSSYLLSGFFAQTLAYGGAYSQFPCSSDRTAEALRLADDVFSDFGRNYRDLTLFTFSRNWCQRFHDIAWDHTWIVSVPSLRTLTILLASDTD
jgi:hypothetical protein